MSAVRQFRDEGERPLKVPSPPAPTAVFTGVGGRALPRSEAVDDAMIGHVEKMSKIIAQLVEEAGGEQYRCPQCGSFGPKVSD